MPNKKKTHPSVKSELHPRNKHRGRYNFSELIATTPELASFVAMNAYDDYSIDFFNPEAVKMLNKALLQHFYGITNWNVPENYLCPPIPGRADYIHYVADLLSLHNGGHIPTGNKIQCLDIGVGANCIYPLIGNKEYGWSFLGVDTDPLAVESANKIIDLNPALKNQIEIYFQPNPKDFFQAVIRGDEHFDITVCNPPFHASLEEARSNSIRKLSNLTGKKIMEPVLNFSGQPNELWCKGGEVKFVGDMVLQSENFYDSCYWFSTLISRKDNLPAIYQQLEKVKPYEVKIIEMGQGNKISRIVAWTFLNATQQEEWMNTYWN